MYEPASQPLPRPFWNMIFNFLLAIFLGTSKTCFAKVKKTVELQGAVTNLDPQSAENIKRSLCYMFFGVQVGAVGFQVWGYFLSQWENFKSSWLPRLIILKKLNFSSLVVGE